MKAVITVADDKERIEVSRMLMQAMNAIQFYPSIGSAETTYVSDLMCKLRDSIKVQGSKK